MVEKGPTNPEEENYKLPQGELGVLREIQSIADQTRDAQRPLPLRSLVSSYLSASLHKTKEDLSSEINPDIQLAQEGYEMVTKILNEADLLSRQPHNKKSARERLRNDAIIAILKMDPTGFTLLEDRKEIFKESWPDAKFQGFKHGVEVYERLYLSAIRHGAVSDADGIRGKVKKGLNRIGKAIKFGP